MTRLWARIDTAASLAVSAGANIKAVQRLLGHASAAMTLDIYSGVFSEDLDDVALRLNKAALKGQKERSAKSLAVVVDLSAASSDG